ncbi:hypothetical protein [Altericista sp. CCNU0014]|uniref:hypothetical protein n=1 Tax=Altericista sp. CCNU0014 TaxID=3082949 RepID=UPI00384D5245
MIGERHNSLLPHRLQELLSLLLERSPIHCCCRAAMMPLQAALDDRFLGLGFVP